MSSPRIAIVGAGAAGISAAARLVENGFDNIIILEAEDRIGGRINTVEVEGNLVDLGAQYCRENSFVYNLIKDYDLLEQRKARIELYHSKHGRLPDNFVLELLGRFDALYSQEKKDITWEQHIHEKYSECVVDHFDDEKDKLLAQNCLSFIENVFITNLGVTSLSSTGQKLGELPSAFTLHWKTGGYRSLFDILMKKYPNPENDLKIDEKIALKKEVTKINWGENVNLSCSDGSTYTADYAIITIPLGALKNLYPTLFLPSLPTWKMETIDLLAFTGSTIATFHFREKWWNNNDIFFAWNPTDIKAVDFNKGPNKNGMSWITGLMGFYVDSRNPNILLAWFFGEMIQEIEQTEEHILLEGIHYVTQMFLGNTIPNITKPYKVSRFNWFSNPHFCGTTTAQTMESKKRGVSKPTLAEPVLSDVGEPRLLFAGEATSYSCDDFVNGAVSSGFREADRIIEMYK